jgi:hypothetical protein
MFKPAFSADKESRSHPGRYQWFCMKQNFYVLSITAFVLLFLGTQVHPAVEAEKRSKDYSHRRRKW